MVVFRFASQESKHEGSCTKVGDGIGRRKVCWGSDWTMLQLVQ